MGKEIGAYPASCFSTSGRVGVEGSRPAMAWAKRGNGSPTFTAYRPVSNAARVGVHTGWA